MRNSKADPKSRFYASMTNICTAIQKLESAPAQGQIRDWHEYAIEKLEEAASAAVDACRQAGVDK